MWGEGNDPGILILNSSEKREIISIIVHQQFIKTNLMQSKK